MKILVTGGAGFVGSHLVTSLRQRFGASADLVMTSKGGGEDIAPLDVTDAEAVTSLVRALKPTHVFHLAAMSAVMNARAHADLVWRINLFGTLNLANAVMREAPGCALIFIGSGQVYGASAKAGRTLDEQALLAPMNAYAVTKAAADLALGVMAEQGLRCLRLRPFNHTGAGQTEEFVIPSFAMQIARIEAGLQPPVLSVGNLDVERDFLDVQDVADAYALAVQTFDTLPNGAVYNVASGQAQHLSSVLKRLIAMSDASIEIRQDPARMRPADVPFFVGNADRAKRDLGWEPTISFDETLRGMLAASRVKIAALTRA